MKALTIITLLLPFLSVNPAIAGFGASARVFDPPSNVRHTPNGAIVCSIQSGQEIYMIGKANRDWYITDACTRHNSPGTVWGVIHKSQIDNIQFYSPFHTLNLSGFYNCLQTNQGDAPENCAISSMNR